MQVQGRIRTWSVGRIDTEEIAGQGGQKKKADAVKWLIINRWCQEQANKHTPHWACETCKKKAETATNPFPAENLHIGAIRTKRCKAQNNWSAPHSRLTAVMKVTCLEPRCIPLQPWLNSFHCLPAGALHFHPAYCKQCILRFSVSFDWYAAVCNHIFFCGTPGTINLDASQTFPKNDQFWRVGKVAGTSRLFSAGWRVLRFSAITFASVSQHRRVFDCCTDL